MAEMKHVMPTDRAIRKIFQHYDLRSLKDQEQIMQACAGITFILSLIALLSIGANAVAQSSQCSPPQGNVDTVICNHVILLDEYENIQAEQ